MSERLVHSVQSRDFSILKKFLTFYARREMPLTVELLESVLCFASACGDDLDRVVAFARNSCDFDFSTTSRVGKTLLVKLSERTHHRQSLMTSLFKHGAAAAINVADKHNNYPVHNAVTSCDAASVFPLELFLRHGADPNVRNRKGQTPLQLVMWFYEGVPFKKIIGPLLLLLRAGADVNDDLIVGCLFGMIKRQRSSPDLQRVLRMFRYAGLSVERLHVRMRKKCAKPGCQCQYCAAMRYFAEVEESPATLAFQCRMCVRQQLVRHGRCLLESVPQLQCLPLSLSKALMLEDI